jgi:hypothetical protein
MLELGRVIGSLACITPTFAYRPCRPHPTAGQKPDYWMKATYTTKLNSQLPKSPTFVFHVTYVLVISIIVRFLMSFQLRDSWKIDIESVVLLKQCWLSRLCCHMVGIAPTCLRCRNRRADDEIWARFSPSGCDRLYCVGQAA